MNLGSFSSFCNQATGNGVLFYYTGAFSQNVIGTMSDTVKERLEAFGASGPARRKVFSAFVEMAQNIVHYADAAPGGGKKIGALAVGCNDDGKFYVLCANPIRMDQVERVKSKLEPLRTMTIDEIKLAYREQLRNDEHQHEDTVSRGAGLGFLTVARESSEPITYQISYGSGQDAYAEFYLRAAI